MSRGRKPVPPANVVDVEVNHEAVATDLAAIDGENKKRLARIEELYGDGDVYRLETCIAKAKFHFESSAESLLAAGRQLIRIKEHEPHGEFVQALDRLGVHPRMAQRVMQATTKFHNQANAKLVSHLGRTKILDLAIEDEETIDSFAKGGTLYGLTLDDVDCMSPTELRNKLRDERKKRKHDQEAHERLLVDKNKKIDQLAKVQGSIPKLILDLRQKATLASGEAIAGINKMTRVRLDARDVPGYDDHVEEYAGAIGVTFLQALYQVQAYLTEEIGYAEAMFSGTKIEIRATTERGPDLSEEEIQALKDAGAEEAARVLLGDQDDAS
jgi:hypothetical protein